MAPGYEAIRLKNIEDNKRILAELGLLVNPYKKFTVLKDASKRRFVPSSLSPPAKRLKLDFKIIPSEAGRTRRRSARLLGQEPGDGDCVEECEEVYVEPSKRYIPRDNFHGQIDGVEVGTIWETRMECSQAGIHRPTVAGIHGSTEEGAYSVALSGGYEDNIDLGECFTYTGEGGRDLKGTKANPKNLRTAPQSKDQTLTRGNLALSCSVTTQRPVRVIRGYKLPTKFAPEWGYRYDGLYTVTKCWYTTGASGFGVWKFAFKRCENQPSPPWSITQQDDQESHSETGDSGFETASRTSISEANVNHCDSETDADQTSISV